MKRLINILVTTILYIVFLNNTVFGQSNNCGALLLHDSLDIKVNDTISRTLVPDENTAKKIAEAIWLPIYGERILKQRPYKAIESNDIWIVRGIIPELYRDDPNVRGGTAYIQISKKDAKVLKVTHGR